MIIRNRIAAYFGAIPQIARGVVWCTVCGRDARADGVNAIMSRGWPMCCGQTMTIDSPDERRALTQGTTT